MAKTKEEIMQTLQEDLSKFQEKVDYYKKHKVKALNPTGLNELIASASLVAYITERLKLFEEE